MRVLCSIVWLTLLAGLGSAQDQKQTKTRIAGVEIDRAFREFQLTSEAMSEFNKERRAIAAGSRAGELSKLADEVKQVDQAVADVAKDDKSARARALRVAELKREEYRALEKALRETRAKRTTELNRRLVAASRRLLAQVCEVAAEVGRERGYDLVVDTSGQTNTRIPLILYARKLPDITTEVIARLDKIAKTPPKAKPAPN